MSSHDQQEPVNHQPVYYHMAEDHNQSSSSSDSESDSNTEKTATKQENAH